MRRVVLFVLVLSGILFVLNIPDLAGAPVRFPIPKVTIDVGASDRPADVSLTLEILLLLTILTLAPAIVMMVTSFVRVVIVFSFISRALATQQMPPTQVVSGLALFLTFFIMSPILIDINQNALQPYLNRQISVGTFYERSMTPLRGFMFRQTREKDIALFIHLGKVKRPKNKEEVPTYVLIPAFMLSELTTSFKMGILIFIPFIMIDLIVSSILMSMGMIMLPPIMISLPLKIVLFVLVDGWNLITYSLVKSFH
ncbi:MAG: flagellar type III secretion system pore protein FliP [bacterium]|nr:flagellar type III secretion system pore protein FliP [bacterium]